MIFNNETSIILSKRLKELREERGISQETLLEQLNSAGIKISLISLKNYEVTEQHHSKFLAVNGMNTEFLFNIAEFYGVSIDYLLGRTDTRSPNPDIQDALRRKVVENENKSRRHSARRVQRYRRFQEAKARMLYRSKQGRSN
jgi:transcriptional regulator with XRE-family HTH domain